MSKAHSTKTPRFSNETLRFIVRASRQKSEHWLDKNREDYESLLLNPLRHLAEHLKEELQNGLASGYHFPLKGIGRLKRSARSTSQSGFLYKDWISYSASRPASSRFEKNPSLFFLLNPEDEDGDQVLVAGGLYMPSSRQTKAIREAIAKDAKPFERLFKTKAFSSRFPDGFCMERASTRCPRGFDASHPYIHWIQLQAFFVWRSYSMREFSSEKFANHVASDFKQVLLLNDLLDQAIQGKWKSTLSSKPKASLLSHLVEVDAPTRKMDF